MLEPNLNDDTLSRRLAGLRPDGLTIFTLEGDSIRGVLSSATTMVAGMRAAHGLGLLETAVLGKAYVAASLLSATIKGDDRIAMKVEGDGPAQGFSVECTASGDVRGRLFQPEFELGSLPESLDTAPLIGAGTISLTRFMAGETEPVSGSAALRSGRIAEDLAWYFHISEQTRSSFTIGLHFDAEGRVAGAGGLFLQALPGASDEALDRVERLVYGIAPLGETFASGASRMDICLRSFPFFDYNHLDDKPIRFHCGCSKERLGAYIGALPLDELSDMAANGPFPVEVKCHNCGSVYRFNQDELGSMLASRNSSV
jgi:molecular chaperone Hsp33